MRIVAELFLAVLGLALLSYAAEPPRPQPTPDPIQMRCFPEGTLGTWGFAMCPDGYEYSFKDI